MDIMAFRMCWMNSRICSSRICKSLENCWYRNRSRNGKL